MNIKGEKMIVLVINSGSSSLRAQLINTDNEQSLASAYCERIGIGGSFMTYKHPDKVKITKELPTHKEAFQLVLDTFMDHEIGVISSLDEIKAVGHRLVNFGPNYNKSTLVTKEVYEDLEKCIHFSPLHNNAALVGLKVCAELMPDKPNVAVFDTAFHSTMPEKAYMYAIPYYFYEKHNIRKYGAHGTSHRYIARKCEELFGDLKGKKIISCHIGSGSSLCAIKDGKCIDTTMGFTPLAGVVMGTRSGDIDPSVVREMVHVTGKDIDEVTQILNKESGVLGISEQYSDMRDIEDNLDQSKIKLAFDMLTYSIKKYVGAYTAIMGGLDYIVFTAGVGEKSNLVRDAVCSDMEYLGISIDHKKNEELNWPADTIMDFSTPDSKVKILRIPTDEELMIALDTEATIK